MAIVQTPDDTHPQAGMDAKSLDAQIWFGPSSLPLP